MASISKVSLKTTMLQHTVAAGIVLCCVLAIVLIIVVFNKNSESSKTEDITKPALNVAPLTVSAPALPKVKRVVAKKTVDTQIGTQIDTQIDTPKVIGVGILPDNKVVKQVKSDGFTSEFDKRVEEFERKIK